MSEQIMENDGSSEITSTGTIEGENVTQSTMDLSKSAEIVVQTLKSDPEPEPKKVIPKKSKPVDIAANGIFIEGSAEMEVQNYSTIKLSNTKVIVFSQRGKKYKFTRA